MTDPFVGHLTYIRVYSGVLKTGQFVYNSTQKDSRAHGALAADACEQARGNRIGRGGRHRRLRGAEERDDRRHALR